ncbi:hypothetical protein IFM89_009167 [Coptis chinensis]|uniref:Endonuclease/exonuclease/phosphatase domain-containing protein n=1 Tax=Coptis chinensis TaxID=261450 RepID=A0A835IV60_9MAGN|nr:hypothetical protein IFM89_009167 [Coptis chinensis]
MENVTVNNENNVGEQVLQEAQATHMTGESARGIKQNEVEVETGTGMAVHIMEQVLAISSGMITSSALAVFEAAKEKEATIYDPVVDDLVTPNRFRVLEEADNLLNGKWADQVEHDRGQVITKKGYKPMWQEPWYHIEELVLTHNPEFLCIVEPLIKPPNALLPVLSRHSFSANILHNNTPHKVGNLWIFWKDGLTPTLVSLSQQQITIKVKNSLMTFVHASSSYGIRRELWQELSLLSQSNQAWAVIGDFNIITSVAEKKKKGGGTPCLVAMDDFNHFIHSNALIDSTTLGFKYSLAMDDFEAFFYYPE